MPRDFGELVQQLSSSSVQRATQAYADIEWDPYGLQLDASDPRWVLQAEIDPLAATTWYQSQSLEARSQIGLARTAQTMKTGIDFESVLMQGLLAYARTLPNGAPEFRYVYHEIAEEIQHSLMFQEFVNRSGFNAYGFTPEFAPATGTISKVAETSPELLFLCALSGEEPIDRTQRDVLQHFVRHHPLLVSINALHVAEEARHISFARAYLRNALPDLSDRDRRQLSYQAPLIVGRMIDLMLRLPQSLIDEFSIPDQAVDDANEGPAATSLRHRVARRIAALCKDVGLLTERTKQSWENSRLISDR